MIEEEVEEEVEKEVEGSHEFEDESGGLFCALFIPDASRYGHGPHPTVVSVYGGDIITTSIHLSIPSFFITFLLHFIVLIYSLHSNTFYLILFIFLHLLCFASFLNILAWFGLNCVWCIRFI